VSSEIGPCLLRADNFTPPARTPWGGTRLARDYKRAWLAEDRQSSVVGESWEISVEPDFPARLEDGTALTDYIARDPEGMLGEEHRRGRTGTALLVKLIDTHEPLSVQIHPSDDYAGLLPGECGKPESWYVVAREPGAGLYLGFRSGTTEADVRSALLGQRSLRELLRFVPVEPGDFFVIDAGTPHAIGEGLTLVEPQHVMPGLRGVTYRYWDWDRRYDAAGRACEAGVARPLHVEHALAVTAWERVQREDFAASIRVRAGEPDMDTPPQFLRLAGPGGLSSQWLRVARLSGTGAINLPGHPGLLGITVLSGSVSVDGVTAERGRSMLVPARSGRATAQLASAHAIVSAVALS
jgi:mannose-6-phosphate isomerase